MKRVARLSEAVANQIAAGEVVERPASAVKELLENALDAEATRLRVDVEGGGVELIRVVDDGHGMERDDALLALERHATSKIRDAADLHQVSTLGFRGEALPSIASVSRFTLVTQPRDAEGTRVTVEGGLVREVSAAGAAQGTEIEVRDLFFNLPVRRKFLKSPQTELGHISDAVVRLALARPDVAFTLVSAGRTLLEVPREVAGDPRGRLGRILGRPVAERLHPIEPDGRPRAVEVSGFISAPELDERTPRSLHVFINGRYVRDRTIQHAIQDAYRTLLERGRHPVVVLRITMDPAQVDVNVHPQKIEVRFLDSGEVHRAVTGALTRTLVAQPWLAEPGARRGDGAGAGELGGASLPGAAVRRYVLGVGAGARAAPGAQAEAGALGPLASSGALRAGALVRDGGRPYALRAARPVEDEGPGWAPIREGATAGVAVSDEAAQPAGPRLTGPGAAAEVDAGPRASQAPLPPAVLGGRFGGLEPVGQVLATYLVCQAPGRVVLIDQHAAHERIAFERMRKEWRAHEVSRQPLLVPLPIELDAGRAAQAHDARERLLALGLELEPFGGATWLVKSRPAALGSADLERLVKDLLDELASVGETTPFEERLEALLSCAACHTVVRAGDRLTAPEIKALLRDMDSIDFGAHCPHGRPVFVEWSERDLGALFHRT